MTRYLLIPQWVAQQVTGPTACRLRLALTLILVLGSPLSALAIDTTGFLVVAPDRGLLGNRETQHLFQEFAQEHAPAAFVFTGRTYQQGIGSEYYSYLADALAVLRRQGGLGLWASLSF